MNKPSVFWRSGTGCQDLVVCSSIKKWRGVLHLAIFLILVIALAFSAQTVYADGGTPSTEDETPPAEDGTPPVQDETLPAEDKTPPVDSETENVVTIPGEVEVVVTTSGETDSLSKASTECADGSAVSGEGEEAADCVENPVTPDESEVDTPGTDSESPDSNVNLPTDSDATELDSANPDASIEPEAAENNNEILAGEPPAEPQLLPDPQFCQDGSTPADADLDGYPPCAEERLTIQAAIDDAVAADEAGTIYLEKDVTFTDAFIISGIENNLTLSGGWDFSLNTFVAGNTSFLNGPISILNSLGLIKFENIIFGELAIITVENSIVEIGGTGGNDALEITLTGTNTSEVTVDGKDGSDAYTVNLCGGSSSKTVNINGSGGNDMDFDSLVINGTDVADEFVITAASVSLAAETVNFSSIEMTSINGKDGIDRLIGPDTTTEWKITGNDAGKVAGINFSSIENLTGGAGDDTFIFSNGKGVSGSIDGGGGENTLDYSAYTSPIVVNLNSEVVTADGNPRDQNSATGVGEGISNILNVTGGSGDDILIGTGYGGTLTGGGGNDSIIASGPQLIIGALKMFLQDFQQELFSNVFGNAIPLIGDALSKECNDEIAVCPGAFITEYILAALEDFDNSLVVDIDSFLDEFNSALGLALSLTFVTTSNPFQVELSKNDVLFEIPFGTGLYGLPLSIGVPGEEPPAVINLHLDWAFTLTFGMDDLHGFFVSPGGTQLTIDVDASFLDQEPHLGTIGLFQAKVIDGVDGNFSGFVGTYNVTLAGTDNIYGAELFDVPVQGSLTSGTSQIYLTIELAAFVLGEDLGLPKDIPNLFNMALKAEVSISWNFVDADTSVAHEAFGGVPSVHFDNIYLDPGPFFNQMLRPFIEGIQKITLPLQPIIDILLAPIPLLSEFDLLPGTVLELLGASDGIVAAINLINKINKITLGSSDCVGGADECLWIPIGDGFDVTDPRVEDAKIPVPEPLFGDWQPTWQLTSDKYGFSMGGDLFGEDEFDHFDFPILEDPNEIYGMLLGIHGRFFTINLSEMDLGKELPDDLKACLWQMLCIKFYGEIGLTAGPMEFGYDTKGIADFVQSSTGNVALLANGFYIADLCKVDGVLGTCDFPYGDDVDVKRVPLLELHFDIGVAVSLGIDLYVFSVEAGVAGGVEGSIRFNLHDGLIGVPDDPNIDGRIRGSEIGWNSAFGWTCIFDIEGEIEAYLKIYVEVSTEIDLGLFSITITWYENSWDIARVTLVEFCQSCEGEPPALAHLEGDVLILHTGDNAGKLTQLSGYSENEYFVVSRTGETSGAEIVIVSAYGFEQQFEGVHSIWADGGAGNDKIIINSGVLSDATLVGGNGDDTLFYKGSGTAHLYGEAGNDVLKGSSGENHLYGGKLFGSDEDGDKDTPGRIWIEPDPENNIGIYDEVNGVWVGYWERQFNDQLFGGSGINWLYAGNGDDKLFGGTGENHMFGEAGDDVLNTGSGENFMYGGTGNDSFIWTTGGGIATIFGGEDENSLFLNLKKNTSQLTVGAEESTGQVWVDGELNQIVFFDEIQKLTINPSVGTQVVINDVFDTTLRRIYVNTKIGVDIGSPLDSVTIFGRALNDNILVDTQPIDDAGEIQSVHVGFCADSQTFCPADNKGDIDYLLELFVTSTSVSENDLLVVNGGNGDDVFQVRPGLKKKVSDLINLELQGGADFDTVLGLDMPNTWTMTGTNSGDLNTEFNFSGMEKLVGGTDFDTLIGPDFASTFKMVSDFDGILNDGLYYFSMEKLVGGSSSDTLIGSDTYNFWSLLAFNDGQLFRFAGPDGLMALLDELQAAGLFTNNGIYKGLRNRLELAQKALEMGRLERAAMEMWMFIWKLDEAALRGQVILPGGNTMNACNLSDACRVGGTLVYYSFENLTGGNSDDLFVFEDGMGVSGMIDGADGSDWLDYSNYSTTVHINVKQGYATGTGSVLNIERIFGRAPARDYLANVQNVALLGINIDLLLTPSDGVRVNGGARVEAGIHFKDVVNKEKGSGKLIYEGCAQIALKK